MNAVALIYIRRSMLRFALACVGLSPWAQCRAGRMVSGR